MNHENFNLLVAKCYCESESFRKEYESLMEEKKKELDVVKKNFIPSYKVYKIKEEQIEDEFAQKVADLCKQTTEALADTVAEKGKGKNA